MHHSRFRSFFYHIRTGGSERRNHRNGSLNAYFLDRMYVAATLVNQPQEIPLQCNMGDLLNKKFRGCSLTIRQFFLALFSFNFFCSGIWRMMKATYLFPLGRFDGKLWRSTAALRGWVMRSRRKGQKAGLEQQDLVAALSGDSLWCVIWSWVTDWLSSWSSFTSSFSSVSSWMTYPGVRKVVNALCPWPHSNTEPLRWLRRLLDRWTWRRSRSVTSSAGWALESNPIRFSCSSDD